jgi:hypothetical protein
MAVKTYTIEYDGLTLRVEATDIGGGQLSIKVLSEEGSANINAFYWSDGDTTTGEGSFSGFNTKKDSSLNMEGTDVSWDGGIKLSDAGLGKTPPSTYLQEGGSYTFTITASLEDLNTIGIRATSTSTAEGSIKGVAQVDTPPPDDFPTWAQDISNVVLYFDQTAGDTKPVGGDSYYTVKINTDAAAGDDLDAWIGDALTWLQANDPNIDENSELLGVAIKGGNISTQYYAYGDNNLNGTDPDTIPDGAPEIVTPPAQGNVDPSAIDETYQYDGMNFTNPELVA